MHLVEANLWCDTCQPLGSQHGSRSVLFHVPASRHWWGSIKTGIYHAATASQYATRQALYRLSYAGSANTPKTFGLGTAAQTWYLRIQSLVWYLLSYTVPGYVNSLRHGVRTALITSDLKVALTLKVVA